MLLFAFQHGPIVKAMPSVCTRAKGAFVVDRPFAEGACRLSGHFFYRWRDPLRFGHHLRPGVERAIGHPTREGVRREETRHERGDTPGGEQKLSRGHRRDLVVAQRAPDYFTDDVNLLDLSQRLWTCQVILRPDMPVLSECANRDSRDVALVDQ